MHQATPRDAPDAPTEWGFVLPPEAAGSRVDQAVAGQVPLSRSRVQALIRQGALRCDDAVLADPAAMARAGARYVLRAPATVEARPAAQAMPLAILHEDRDIIVLDKPAGLVVHPAPGHPDGTLVNALVAHCGDTLSGIGGERRPGIVHRLDRDTTGVMVVAKTELALAALSADFAARRLDRRYVALCWGVIAPASGAIEAPIGRDPRDRKRMAVVASGRPALTHYRTLRSYPGRAGALSAGVSFLECRLSTGRTHQIRVHFARQGHPLVGDPVYLRRVPAAAASLPAATRGALLDFPRQALHAATLAIRHPRSGTELRFEAPVPEDLAGLLGRL